MAEMPQLFVDLVARVTGEIAGRTLDDKLGRDLNVSFPPDGKLVEELQALCRTGCDEGWLCAREHGGIRFGRPIKPGPLTHGFSVDVVDMADIAGPHHGHPKGEIDLVMPFAAGATFDGVQSGWKVYGAGSTHRPTVSGGRALVLYLLPDGEIEFTHA